MQQWHLSCQEQKTIRQLKEKSRVISFFSIMQKSNIRPCLIETMFRVVRARSFSKIKIAQILIFQPLLCCVYFSALPHALVFTKASHDGRRQHPWNFIIQCQMHIQFMTSLDERPMITMPFSTHPLPSLAEVQLCDLRVQATPGILCAETTEMCRSLAKSC